MSMTRTAGVNLTERAAERIKAITAGNGLPPMLRLSVEGGGCSGFQYKFDLTSQTDTGDIVIEQSGASLVVDQVSLLYLGGAEVDYVDELASATFRVVNPNASASCGCGTSFSV